MNSYNPEKNFNKGGSPFPPCRERRPRRSLAARNRSRNSRSCLEGEKSHSQKDCRIPNKQKRSDEDKSLYFGRHAEGVLSEMEKGRHLQEKHKDVYKELKEAKARKEIETKKKDASGTTTNGTFSVFPAVSPPTNEPAMALCSTFDAAVLHPL